MGLRAGRALNTDATAARAATAVILSDGAQSTCSGARAPTAPDPADMRPDEPTGEPSTRGAPAHPPAADEHTIDAAGSAPAAAETAHQHLVTRVPTARVGDTARTLLAKLHAERFEVTDPVYLVDGDGVLTGVVALADLLGADPSTAIAELATPPPPAVPLGTDQEDVASHAILHGIAAVPVVGRGDRLLGVVPPVALLEVLRHEHVEDLHRIAGIVREEQVARQAIEAPPVRRARHRLPWLIGGLAASALSAIVMKRYEDVLQSNLTIAFFIPAIVYLADAIGTQSEAIAVRGLSLSRKPLLAVLGGELRTGLLIGAVLSLLALVPVWLFVGDTRLAIAVAAALFVASATATVLGFSLPWLLARGGADPAFGSGPVATIAQDVLSLLIYFATVSLLLL